MKKMPDKRVAVIVKDHKRKHNDDDDDDNDDDDDGGGDEDPPAGPNQGKNTKRGRTKESESLKKPSSTKETPKGKAPSKGSKTDKSVLQRNRLKNLLLRWPFTPDSEWNKRQVILSQPEQPWFNQMVSATKDPLTLNDLMATPIDFSNDLEYLKSFDPERTYTTSITKTKTALYEIVGIEDMVPTLCSTIKHAYDKDAAKGIKHWGERRKLWYRSHVGNSELLLLVLIYYCWFRVDVAAKY
ncbi:hypothetical protein Tco_1498303 [Tanacetum coccineum]